MWRLYSFLSILILASVLVSCAPSMNTHPINSDPQPTATKSLEDYRLKIGLSTVVALTEAAQIAAQTQVALSIPPADCPVTTAESASFKAPEPFSPTAPWEGLFWYGTEGLWTALHTDGVWSKLPKTSDGYTQKIMWWSDKYVLKDELEPALVVSGQRLDAKSEPLRFYGATNAMADDIREAMLTGVEFPTLGCWEVKAEYKNSELTFVVWIAP